MNPINKSFGIKIGDVFHYRGRIYAVTQFITFGSGFIYCVCVDGENIRHHFNPISIHHEGRIIEI